MTTGCYSGILRTHTGLVCISPVGCGETAPEIAGVEIAEKPTAANHIVIVIFLRRNPITLRRQCHILKVSHTHIEHNLRTRNRNPHLHHFPMTGCGYYHSVHKSISRIADHHEIILIIHIGRNFIQNRFSIIHHEKIVVIRIIENPIQIERKCLRESGEHNGSQRRHHHWRQILRHANHGKRGQNRIAMAYSLQGNHGCASY